MKSATSIKLFSVRTQLLAAVGKWACQSDDRPHLARVLFDGKHMVATDGHRLVAVSCETDLPPFTIHRVDCAVLAAAQREITKHRSAELVFLAVADGQATIDLDGGRSVLAMKTGDAKDFPPWQKMFEGLKAETPTPPAYAFEPRYLAAMDEVIQGVTGDVQRTIEVKAWTAKEPGGFVGPMLFESVVFDGTHGYEMRFLIMPKRS